MQYEETPTKNSKNLSKDIKLNNLDKVGTPTILWHLIKRHKFGIVATYAVVITIFYLLPFVPDLMLSVVKGL